MSNENLEDLVNVNAGHFEEGQGVASSFKALSLSNPSAVGLKPCISLPTETVDPGEHTRDSGYGSVTSTPNSKDTAIPPRKSGQIPLIRQSGLCVSNKIMDPETKRRFVEVQLEIEKMLLELMHKLKSGPGRYKPIVIRPMMLGKTDSDTDANPYMVFICSKSIKRKIQDFVDGPLVKSLCESGDDDVPSFKALVIGHALRLRASNSDISVHCGPLHNSYWDTTFCGTPIRLCDERGHSRNATFGGMVKVAFDSEDYRLYGITAGHMIEGHEVVIDEEATSLDTPDGRAIADLDLSDEVMEVPGNQTRTGSPTLSDIELGSPDNWYFGIQHQLGEVFDADRADRIEALVTEEQSRAKPFLDWALFEVNIQRPNKLAYHGREHSGGDLHLPLSTKESREEEIPVSMLCASQGVKHGVLSTTRARVLLDPGHSFIDAYTLSLDGSKVSDGDSGSWVVDEQRLEVYGHVVADDVFGDAYVIPMSDILADIQRCLGAESVSLPSGLDIYSMASKQWPDSLAGIGTGDWSRSHYAAGTLREMPDFSNKGGGIPALSEEEERAATGNFLTEFARSTPPTSLPIDLPRGAGSGPPSEAFILDDAFILDHIIRPPYTDGINLYAKPNAAGKSPRVIHGSGYGSLSGDSGYSSLHATPNTYSPNRIQQSPLDEDTNKSIQGRVREALEAADIDEFESLTYNELAEKFQLLFASLFGLWLSLVTVRSLRRMPLEVKRPVGRKEEIAALCEFLGSRQTLFNRLTSDDLHTSPFYGTSSNMSPKQFIAALSALKYWLSPKFVAMFYRSSTRHHGGLMNLADFVEACIKLERMRHIFKGHDMDRDGYIRMSFEDCLSMMVELMD